MQILLVAFFSFISVFLVKIMSKSPTAVLRWLGILSILSFSYLGFVSWKELQNLPKEPKHMNLLEASSMISRQLTWVIVDDLQWDCSHIFYKEVNHQTHTYIIFSDKDKSLWGFSFFPDKMSCEQVAQKEAVGILKFANSAERADLTSLGFDVTPYEKNNKFLSLCTYCGTSNSRTGVIIASSMVVLGVFSIVASSRLAKKNRLLTTITGYTPILKPRPQTAASIYLETYNDTATLLIPVSTALPTVWQSVFSTAKNEQTSIDINLLYGTSLKASQDTLLGGWTISGIPLLARGEPQIIVQVHVDITGNISVQSNLNHNALTVIAKTQVTKVPVKVADAGMILECANSKPIQNPTDSDINWLFADDQARGDFVILSQSAQYYVQAAGDGNGSYTLECRTGDKEHHFRCTQSLNKHTVQKALLKYLHRDPSFITDLMWEKVEL